MAKCCWFYDDGVAINCGPTMNAKILLLLGIASTIAFSANAQSWITNGLVAQYPLDGNTSDATGHGADGTPSLVVFETDRFGSPLKSASFNGSANSNIKINSTNWNLLPSFTASVWFKFDANAGTVNPRVLSTSGYEIGTQTTGGSRNIFFNNTTVNATAFTIYSSNSVPSGVWVHAVGVRTPNQMRLYLNGVLAGTTAVTGDPDYSRGLPEIGGNFGSDSDAFSGSIDDIRIYNRALTPAEIRALYVRESQATNQGTFRFVYGDFTWQEAKADAEARGGHLAAFRDQTEWLAGKAAIAGGQNVWIGGYQPAGSPEPGGGWAWVTGQPWSFTAWWPGEPNQNQGFNEDALMVGFGGEGWNDAPSDTRFCYLLETEPRVNLIKAVKPSFDELIVGSIYQLQLSAGLNSWTNHGAPFSATNSSMIYPQYWDVENWGSLFFRIQAQ